MRITEVRAQDFMGYATLQLALDGYGPVVVRGNNLDGGDAADSNYSGKSALFDAVFWGLYEQTARGATGADVVRERQKECWVEVDLTDDDGNVTTIRRERDKRGSKCSLEQHIVEAMLGMSAGVFRAVCYFGQAALVPWCSMTDKAIKAMFEESLRLGEYRAIYDEAASARNTAQRSLTITQDAVRQWERQLEGARASLQSAQDSDAAWAQTHQEALERIRAQAKAALANVSPDPGPPPDIDARREAVRREIKEHLDALRVCDQASAACSIAVTAHKIKAGQVEYAAAAIAEHKAKPPQGKGGICEVCGQGLDKDAAANAMRHHKQKLAQLQQALKEAEVKLAVAAGTLADAQHAKTHADAERARRDKALVALNAEAGQLHDSLAQHADKERQRAVQLASAQAARDALKQEQAAANPWANHIRRYQEAVQDAQEQVEMHADAASVLEGDVAVLNYLVQAFGPAGIPSLLLDGVTPILNENAEHYSNILTGGTVAVEFSTQTQLKSGNARERFSVTASNTTGGSNYVKMSGGERRRVDLVCSLAFRKMVADACGKPVNLFVVDEAMDALDTSGQDRVIELLMQEVPDAGTLFVITHNEALAEQFPMQVVITKEHGVSRVEV